jgi:hypothetical protein
MEMCVQLKLTCVNRIFGGFFCHLGLKQIKPAPNLLVRMAQDQVIFRTFRATTAGSLFCYPFTTSRNHTFVL